jgi:APA family basic amino acid/polyamine antiporter
MQESDSLTSRSNDGPALRRVLGRWDLTAIGINQVIGGAIFLVPAQIFLHLGAWSPFAIVGVGLCSILVVLCFAESGSRFESTGGAYLYTRQAFGRFVGLEVAWMQWFTRVTSLASVANGIVMAMGFYLPAAGSGFLRIAIITVITAVLTLVNIWGVKQSASLVNTLTVAKLVPLIGLILLGALHFRSFAYPAFTHVSRSDVTVATLLLVFTFGGFDVIGIPAGEAKSPRRDIPFAFLASVIGVTLIFTLLQLILMGAYPGLATSQTPVADVMQQFTGPAGALFVGAGAVLSMIGNNAGQILSGSRILFALAKRGELPSAFARVHAEYRTPTNAIIVTAAVALTLALTGSFVWLAAVSAIARLTAYAGTAAATMKLRRMDMDRKEQVPPATFVIPGGATVPILALATSVLILAGATRDQLISGTIALVVGALLFAISSRSWTVPDPTAGIAHLTEVPTPQGGTHVVD